MDTNDVSALASHRSGRPGRVARAAVLALALGVALIGCARGSSDAEVTGRPDTSSTTTDTSQAAPTGDQAPGTTGAGSSPTGGSTGGGSTGGGSQPPGGGQPTTPTAPAPTIASFETPEDIDCHNGNLQQFTARWSTTGAVNVTISIDGPGIYDTYGPSGEASLPFNCSSSHTFLLTAHGADGQTATRTVTLQPRNVQTPSEEDDEE